MVTCKELIDFLMAYIDNELPAERRAEFERHLGACPSCVRYLDTYKQTVQLGKQAFGCGGETAPTDVPEGLIQAILAARAKK
jgi:anti-sigma factor (TIGR02949 family)